MQTQQCFQRPVFGNTLVRVIGANKIMKHLGIVQCWFYKLIFFFGGIFCGMSQEMVLCPEKQFVENSRVLIADHRNQIVCNFFTQTFIIVIFCYHQPSNLFQNSNKSFYLKTFMHATAIERDTCVLLTVLNAHNSNWT